MAHRFQFLINVFDHTYGLIRTQLDIFHVFCNGINQTVIVETRIIQHGNILRPVKNGDMGYNVADTPENRFAAYALGKQGVMFALYNGNIKGVTVRGDKQELGRAWVSFL